MPFGNRLFNVPRVTAPRLMPPATEISATEPPKKAQHGQVTTPAAHEPPFALDGTVTLDKLRELLAVQTELTWLDYKESCDLSRAEGQAELTKDVGAMMIDGGYLVIGVDDDGAPVGIPEKQAADYDEAKLAGKISKYLPTGFEVRSAVHDLGSPGASVKVAIVWIAPHPDGWCVFTRNGDYEVNNKAKVAFRAGEVYARHGSRSEPWHQTDIARARARLVAREKDKWRAEVAEEVRRATVAASAQAAASSASASYSWQLDSEAFQAATVEMLRRADDIPVRLMLRATEAEAKAFRDAGNEADFTTVLDRVTTLAALALDLERPQFFDQALGTFAVIFDGVIADRYAPTSRSAPTPVPAVTAALRISERLYALGALAVRLRRWRAVRQIALLPIPSLQAETRGRSWHRHTLTEASRASLLQHGENGQKVSLLLFAHAAAAEHPVLHPDLHGDPSGGSDPLLTSLCQFDLLATVICGVDVRARTLQDLLRVSYPNFGQFDSRRSAGVVRPLLSGTPERAELLGDATDEDLALVLHFAHQAALEASRAYFGWDAFPDDVTQWIEDQVRLSDSQIFQ